MVSVIITFLNAEAFIQEAIESVFAQTYHNWELLLVDDGSTDGGTEIAIRYAQQCPDKVRYLENEGHQNHGTSPSRNLGIRHAKGKYIAFLDADDVWLPNKLKQQVAILELWPEAAMVYGPCLIWYNWAADSKDIQCDFIQQELGVQLNTLVKPPRLVAFFLKGAKRGATPLPSCILVRGEIIERIGGFEDAFGSMCTEDLVFAARVCLAAPVFVADECWLKYRQHPNSRCSVELKTGQSSDAILAFLNWLEDHLLSCQIKDTEVWAALRRRLWPVRHRILYRLSRFVQHPGRYTKKLLQIIVRQPLPISLHRWLQVDRQSYKG